MTSEPTQNETSQEESLFTQAEIASFDKADAQAGRAIGKMLALFFCYTVFMMAIVSWWTFCSSSH